MNKAVVLAAICLAALAALGFWELRWDTSPLEHWIATHPYMGAFGYVLAVAASVVLLPFSSLFLLPLAVHFYGVWLTTLFSATGWWAGSLVAFQIARLGRRYLERIAPLEAIDRLERRIPHDVGFGGIVVLRMVFPVDIVSFALGLLKELSFRVYAVASLVGILPFAALWSFAGGELGKGQLLSFAAIIATMAIAVLVVRRKWTARKK